jgi:hypothetical protein
MNVYAGDALLSGEESVLHLRTTLLVRAVMYEYLLTTHRANFRDAKFYISGYIVRLKSGAFRRNISPPVSGWNNKLSNKPA